MGRVARARLAKKRGRGGDGASENLADVGVEEASGALDGGGNRRDIGAGGDGAEQVQRLRADTPCGSTRGGGRVVGEAALAREKREGAGGRERALGAGSDRQFGAVAGFGECGPLEAHDGEQGPAVE